MVVCYPVFKEQESAGAANLRTHGRGRRQAERGRRSVPADGGPLQNIVGLPGGLRPGVQRLGAAQRLHRALAARLAPEGQILRLRRQRAARAVAPELIAANARIHWAGGLFARKERFRC
jgi:hypothetical protein